MEEETFAGKVVVITGLNGQLGQYLAKYLTDTYPQIRVIGTVRHKSYDDQPYLFDRSKVTVELMDLSDAHSIESLIVKYKPNYFINTAANAFVGESWNVPVQHYDINCLAVLHQLEAIRKHSPNTKYFNMGTSEEFGRVEYSPQDEKHPLRPRSPYGSAKCCSRHTVKVWRESYNLYAIQGWTFNFESEIRGEKYVTRKITKGVARINKAVAKGETFEPIELGSLDAIRSWQHAEDVAKGVWLMLNQNSASPQEYVLSADDTHSVREFVERAFAATGAGGEWRGTGVDETFCFPLMPQAWQVAVRVNPKFFRPNEVLTLHGDSTRARTELGWSPKVSFDQLVERMVKHDMANA